MKRDRQVSRWGFRRAHRAGLASIMLSALAMMLFVGVVPAASAAPVPAATPTQKAEAITKPSTVFIVTKWSGYITSGDLADALATDGVAPKITATTTCSGFIANPDGYVVTAGHCVDDQSMQYGGKGVIIQAAMAEVTRTADLSPSTVSTLLNDAYANANVEGLEKGSPPDRVVGVYPAKGASTIPVTSPMEANVVDFRSFTKGDVALLKVESKSPMPALQVAPQAAIDGSPVVAAGFAGSVLDTVDPNTSDPSFKDGTVSGSRTVSGVPFTEISAATSSGMSGGPVVDMEGRVVGTVSWSPGLESQAFNFITATSAVREMLASHSVSNRLSATDTMYRAGLTDYFNGKYHAAAKKFDQVLALEPDHAQAQDYRRLAVTNYPNEKTSGSNLGLVLGIVGGVIVLLLAGGATFLLLRRRHGRGPVERAPSAAAPVAAAPYAPPLFPPPAPVSATPPAPVGVEPSPAPAEDVHASAGFCPNCGAAHEVDAHFCEACGHHFAVTVPHRNGSTNA